MAKETIVLVTDDIDGSEAIESIRFGFRGIDYEIDLNAKNVTAMEKALEKWVEHGHKVEPLAPRTRLRRSIPSSNSRVHAAEIREWATANGYQVSSRAVSPPKFEKPGALRPNWSVSCSVQGPHPGTRVSGSPRMR